MWRLIFLFLGRWLYFSIKVGWSKNYVLRGIPLYLKGETLATVVKEGTAF